MVTYEQQRAADASGPHTPGEKMMAAHNLSERKLPYDYELFEKGANPDFVARHPAAGRIVLEVYEPEYRLPRNPDGSFRSGSVRSPGHVAGAGSTLIGSTGRPQRHARAVSPLHLLSLAQIQKSRSASTTCLVRCSVPWSLCGVMSPARTRMIAAGSSSEPLAGCSGN